MPWSIFIIHKKRHARDLKSLLFLIGINKYTPNEPTWSRLNLCFVKIPNIIAYLKTSRTSKVAVEGKSVSTYILLLLLLIYNKSKLNFSLSMLPTTYNFQHPWRRTQLSLKKFLSFLINTRTYIVFQDPHFGWYHDIIYLLKVHANDANHQIQSTFFVHILVYIFESV